jgi:glycosyltransferase involved in cell wall biosynthesis
VEQQTDDGYPEGTPLVDVVTVWYNRGYRVDASIGSIIDQDLAGYRVFAVDDGSTDDTRERLEAMVEPARARGVELVVWAKENEGFTRSLKRCIEEKTTAPYIGLHGAGDISDPRRLSTLLAMLQEHTGAAAAGCGVRVVTPEGTVTAVRTRDGIALRDLAGGTVPKPATHECALIRRRAYDAIGGYREFFRYAQDSDLWVRLSRVGTIINTPEILFEKVSIPESVSADWKKSLLQRKYSTLALQAGIAVDRGAPDPIPEIARSEEAGARPRRGYAWEGAVDPRLLLPRYRFWKRIGRAALGGRFGEATGLLGEVFRAYAGSLRWSITDRNRRR